ncbi:unnamed protein product [Prunus armeniaca]
MMLQEVHEVTCNLEPIINLYQCLQRKGYYWPEMKKQAAEMQANCPKCATISSTEESFTISFAKDWRTPYLASFINGVLPTDSKHARKLKKTMKRYLIDGLTLYRKGFNGEPLKCLGESEAQQVIFRIPYKIVTDNGTPFVNKQVSSTLSGYGIKHRRSTPYYPQGNGQVEATNKTLLRILSKMVHEYEGGWSVHLPDALWVYRTSRRSATGFSPYSLVYQSDAISPVKITIPTARDSQAPSLQARRPRAKSRGPCKKTSIGTFQVCLAMGRPIRTQRGLQQRLLSLGLCQRRHADGSHNGKWLKPYYC